MGKKIKADFDKGPFPLFTTRDFKGNRAYYWHFPNFAQAEVNEPFETIEVLENFETGFKALDLKKAAGESEVTFSAKVLALQSQAQAGEFWVANFTQKLGGVLSSETQKNKLVLKLFYEFLKLNKNHCGGIVFTNEQIFCSLSPEVFLTQTKDLIRSFPIKGTGTKAELKSSSKEISELHMITDLMRNDLGQICKHVWLERERYLTAEQNFFHARAQVNGQLPTEVLNEIAFKKLLPAGSISGAPKRRVLQLLAECESFERGFYTGTFGVRLNPENSIFNILIRTLFLETTSNAWSFPVGAGITIESDPKAEWKETLQKAQLLKDCLKG